MRKRFYSTRSLLGTIAVGLLAIIAGPALGQETPTDARNVKTESRFEGCWNIYIDTSSFPDSLAHLPTPRLLPSTVRFARVPSSRIPHAGGAVTEDELEVEYPRSYKRKPFGFWRASGPALEVGSYSPAGFSVNLTAVGEDRLEGMLTSYGASDFFPLPEPNEWTETVTLRSTHCDQFN